MGLGFQGHTDHDLRPFSFCPSPKFYHWSCLGGRGYPYPIQVGQGRAGGLGVGLGALSCLGYLSHC